MSELPNEVQNPSKITSYVVGSLLEVHSFKLVIQPMGSVHPSTLRKETKKFVTWKMN